MSELVEGHPTEGEAARVKLLREKQRANALTRDEALELALLSLEPLHEGDDAAELLIKLIEVDPTDELAKLWLACTYIDEFMDEGSLRKAIALCDEILASPDGTHRAAALLLKAAALQQLSMSQAAKPLLEKSIAAAPDWISNRRLLAKIYEDSGQNQLAKEQLQAILKVADRPVHPDNTIAYTFELLITGRALRGIKDRVEEELRHIS